MTPRKLLLDVGGTFVKCSDGREIPIDSDGGREAIASALRLAVAPALAGNPAAGVVVGIPGPFDYANGVFQMKHKFAAVYGESFCSLTGMPPRSVRFEHDVIAMLRGEIARGNGRGHRRVALVALGTGLGFALSIDGEILRGPTGSPRVPIYNRPYRDGILEDYASKRGFLRGCDGMSVKELASRAKAGDAAAKARFAETGAILGEGVRPVLAEYRIECLLFGGQISRDFELFAPALRQALGDAAPAFVGPISDFDNATFNGLETL